MSAPKIRSNAISPPLPANLDAERSILGAIVLKNEAMFEALPLLRTEDFFLHSHQLIYSAMEELIAGGKPIEVITLMDFLTLRGELESAGGVAYLSQLADGLPKVTSIPHYAKIVKEKSAKRALIAYGLQCQKAGFEKDVCIDELQNRAVDVFQAFSPEKKQEALALKVLDMPPTVLDGHLGEFCQKRLGDFPIAYAWVSLLTVASTLVPACNMAINLYGALIGPIGSGKTQSIKRAIAILGLGAPYLENTLAGSFEGLAPRLNVNGEPRLLSPDELGHLLTKANIDGASFPYVLNTAFSEHAFDALAARGKQFPFNCRLGVVGGIVEEKFSSLFGAATTGGLYDRFLFGRWPQPFQYNFRPFQGGPENTQPCAVTVDGSVWELADAWRKEIPGMSARTAEIVIRTAVISAAFSGRSILYAKQVEVPGRALAEYQARVRQIFRPNPGENLDARCAVDILSALGESPVWYLKRDIARKIHADRFGPTAFERAINSLVAAGEINLDAKRPARIRRVG